MFENIGNPDLKAAFEKLQAYAKKRLVFLFVFVVFISLGLAIAMFMADKTNDQRYLELTTSIKVVNGQIGSMKSSQELPEKQSLPAVAIQTSEVEVPLSVNGAPIEITAPVELGYNGYDSMFEYLEHGDTVEYVHPEQPDGLKVQFWFDYEDIHYYKTLVLDPPHFRAVMEKFPEYMTYAKEGFQVKATVSGETVLEIKSIQDKSGKIVWTPDMVKAPRALNALEEWGKLYAEVHGYDFLLTEFFDEVPECATYRETLGSCRSMYWSPAEERARGEAFYRYATDPKNAVFVQIWGAVDACYRWVDAQYPEKVLANVDSAADLWSLPESGWVGLQIGTRASVACAESKEWETTATIRVTPGFVLGIDQSGYLYNTGPLGWAMHSDSMADRTKEWEQNKIEKLLPDRFEMAND